MSNKQLMQVPFYFTCLKIILNIYVACILPLFSNGTFETLVALVNRKWRQCRCHSTNCERVILRLILGNQEVQTLRQIKYSCLPIL